MEDRTEKFIRDGIIYMIETSTHRKLKNMDSENKQKVADACIDEWRRTGKTGSEIVKWGLDHAKSVYGAAKQ